MVINFSAVKYYLNDLVSHWERVYMMPAEEAEEYAMENEYYQKVKASILQNDLYEDVQTGFCYLLSTTSTNINQYMDVVDWNDLEIRDLLWAAYNSIYSTKELLAIPNDLELKEVSFKDWYKTNGK